MRDLYMATVIIVVLVVAVLCKQAKADKVMRGEDLGEVVHGKLYRFETPSAVCFVYSGSRNESLSCVPNKWGP